MISYFLEIISNLVLLIIGKIGYSGVFLLMVFQSANLPIPSEIIMPFSGFLVSNGVFNFWAIVLVGAFGSLVGSLISYRLAHFIIKNGLRDRHKIIKLIISDKNLESAEKWFNKYGALSIFIGRLMPVISTFISFPAGLAKMKISLFSILTFSGAFIWSLFLTGLGFYLGENWNVLGVYFRKFDYLILALILIAAGWWMWRHFNNRDTNIRMRANDTNKYE